MQKNILHMLFTGDHASPFDVNMAVDSGYDVIVPYDSISVVDVKPLVQDCIYSRPPGYFNHTGIFIGGNDVNQAAQMLTAAGEAMFEPFVVSVFADPNGAYTTSAAMMALVERHMRAGGHELTNSRVVIFGGGPVGLCAAVLAHQLGAQPVLAQLTPGSDSKRAAIDEFLDRYDTSAERCDAQTPEGKSAALQGADVIVSTARAGMEVLSAAILDQHCVAKVAADVNAVPPAGIAGVGAHDNGTLLDIPAGECLAIGALAIGNIKYQTQQNLFKNMLQSETRLLLDFSDAYAKAVELVSG